MRRALLLVAVVALAATVATLASARATTRPTLRLVDGPAAIVIDNARLAQVRTG